MTDQQLSIDQAMALAKKHAKNGQNATAKDIYQRILAQQPNHAGAKRGLKKLPHNASDKNNFMPDMARLTAVFESGREEEALVLATKLAKKYRNQPMPLNVRGAVLLRSGRVDEAIKAFEKAVDIDPRYPDLWTNLGMAHQLNNHPGKAIAAYQRLLALRPNDVSAMVFLGGLYRLEGELEHSANVLERAIALAPENAAALVGYGCTLRMLGEENSALRILRSVIDGDPSNAEAHREFGETLSQKKLYTASLEHLQTAVELNPDNAQGRYLLGMALLSLGNPSNAAEQLERSIELSPGTYPSADHFLAIARGERTSTAPGAYVKHLFDEYAGRFEKSLVGDLGYQGPEILSSLLFKSAGGSGFGQAVDLGCGTGLMGPLLRDKVTRLTGVDLSPRMLKHAEEKAVYDDLIAGDLVEVINQLPFNPELFVCADVLVYIGDILPLFTAVREHAASNAIFAFTTEKLEDGDYELLPTGRYSHSDQYIQETANTVGMEIVAKEDSPLRREVGDWLTGGYYILRAP